jgi:Protein of unknown function (DUF3644)/EC042_2821-lke REase
MASCWLTRPRPTGLLHRRGNPGTKGKLLAKSLEAYLLALETINRLTITYRVETFCTLACNAWELLLKAKILDDTDDKHAIYRPPRPGEGRRQSLSLSECLPKVFLNEHDATRRNLARVEGLRDEAIHLFISEVPKDVLGLLQACVLNYHRCISDWFDVKLSERVPVGMMTIVFDTSPEELDLANPVMRRRLGKESAEYLTSLTQELHDEHDEHGFAPEFSVEIKYSLAIQKRTEGAAVLAVIGAEGTPIRIVQVAKDPSDEYPYRLLELAADLNERLTPEKSISTGDLQAVVFAEHVKQNQEWFFQGKVPGSPPCYSRRFADWFVTRYKQDPSWLPKCRTARRESLRGRPRLATPERSLWPHA